MTSNEGPERTQPEVNNGEPSGEVFEEVDLEAGRPQTSQGLLDGQEGVDGRAVGSSSGVSEEKTMEDCRICLLTDNPDDMVTPCGCEGTLRYCHYKCLEQWAKESRSLKCEICNQIYRQPYRARLMDTVAKVQLSMQERRDAELAVQLGVEPSLAPVQQENTNGNQAKKLWCRMLIVIALTITLLYVILFILKLPHFSSWTIMVLRILSFILPFYLVGRAIVALQRYRQERQYSFA